MLKVILVEKEQWYYSTRYRGYKGARTFSKTFSMKVKMITRTEFERFYLETTRILWGVVRGVGGVRKSIHQSWLAKRLGLGLLCWGFKGVQEEIPKEEASTVWKCLETYNGRSHRGVMVNHYATVTSPIILWASYDKFPDIFRIGTFIDSTHMKL